MNKLWILSLSLASAGCSFHLPQTTSDVDFDRSSSVEEIHGCTIREARKYGYEIDDERQDNVSGINRYTVLRGSANIGELEIDEIRIDQKEGDEYRSLSANFISDDKGLLKDGIQLLNTCQNDIKYRHKSWSEVIIDGITKGIMK